jgi:hypothetical protein
MSLITKDAILSHSADNGSTWTSITPCEEVEAPEFAVSDIEITNLASAGKEFMPGLADCKKITAKIGYTSANLTLLTGLRGVTTTTLYKVAFSDTHGFTIAGYLSSVKCKLEPDKHIVLEVEIKCSGDATVI